MGWREGASVELISWQEVGVGWGGIPLLLKPHGQMFKRKALIAMYF